MRVTKFVIHMFCLSGIYMCHLDLIFEVTEVKMFADSNISKAGLPNLVHSEVLLIKLLFKQHINVKRF